MKRTKKENAEKLPRFGGQIGFVLSSAGCAVGLGNLWRFPYLAARDGGGIFVLVYLLLAVTFGYTMLMTDIVIGRKTGRSAICAYESIHRKWKFVGILVFIVPALVMSYYGVIGGWVTKYTVLFLTGHITEATQEGYFTQFITDPGAPVVYGIVFVLLTLLIVLGGVKDGIEKSARIIMPALAVMMLVVSVFALTLYHTDEVTGEVRTALQGLKVYLIPDFRNLTAERFCQILLDAMIQLFFSLGIAMGIMVTYGSYVEKKVDLNRSVNYIEIFDTGIALLAGMIVVPTTFVFYGIEGMTSGPGLLFISLTNVFHTMGDVGIVVGTAFFFTAFFAALTSSVSIYEAVVANCMEIFHVSRRKASIVLFFIYSCTTGLISLGYSIFYFELPLPNGAQGQLLDIIDYFSNSFMMPLVSLLTCILIGWVVGPSFVTEEIEVSGLPFRRKRLYVFMLRYIAPAMMAVLFLQSTGILKMLIGQG